MGHWRDELADWIKPTNKATTEDDNVIEGENASSSRTKKIIDKPFVGDLGDFDILASPLALRCVTNTADLIASTPLRYRKMDEKGNPLDVIRTGRVAEVLREPNEEENMDQILKRSIVNLQLYGEGVMHAPTDRGGEVEYIDVLYPNEFNKTRSIGKRAKLKWEITKDKGLGDVSTSTRTIKADNDEVLHIKDALYGFVQKDEPCSILGLALKNVLQQDTGNKDRWFTEITKPIMFFFIKMGNKETIKKQSTAYGQNVQRFPNRALFLQNQKIEKIEKPPEMDPVIPIISTFTYFEICVLFGWYPQLFGIMGPGEKSSSNADVDVLTNMLINYNLSIKMDAIEREFYRKLIRKDERDKQETTIKFDDVPFRLSKKDMAEVIKLLRRDAGIIDTNEGRLMAGYGPLTDKEVGTHIAIPAGSPGVDTPEMKKSGRGNNSPNE